MIKCKMYLNVDKYPYKIYFIIQTKINIFGRKEVTLYSKIASFTQYVIFLCLYVLPHKQDSLIIYLAICNLQVMNCEICIILRIYKLNAELSLFYFTTVISGQYLSHLICHNSLIISVILHQCKIKIKFEWNSLTKKNHILFGILRKY